MINSSLRWNVFFEKEVISHSNIQDCRPEACLLGIWKQTHLCAASVCFFYCFVATSMTIDPKITLVEVQPFSKYLFFLSCGKKIAQDFWWCPQNASPLKKKSYGQIKCINLYFYNLNIRTINQTTWICILFLLTLILPLFHSVSVILYLEGTCNKHNKNTNIIYIFHTDDFTKIVQT